MCCLSRRKKQTQDFVDQKWEYINLPDFKAKGCGPFFLYIYLWFSLILSVTVYAVDSFTAVNLIVFNRWSSKIEPTIPFAVSKWVFSGCIIASFANLAYEGFRALRVMKRGNVAECFLDSLAARWESIRLGNGQGWRRFLVFAELTKSKKGAEYIALFTYFSFQSWIRVILCSAPRQVVNGFTLRSVYLAKLNPESESVEGSIAGFFTKIGILATEDYQQAVILSAMCFTLVIWVFSALYLLAAALFYVLFLCHWIPRSDGGLTGYCERKVNKRLTKIVSTKVNKALHKNQGPQSEKEKQIAAAKARGSTYLSRAATLPSLPILSPPKDGTLLETTPMLGRSETTETLPVYSSRPGTSGRPDPKRPAYSRNGTPGSGSSYSSRMPPAGGGADMGPGRHLPEPTVPNLDLGPAGPSRLAGSASHRVFGTRPGYGPADSRQANTSLRDPFRTSPPPFDSDSTPPRCGRSGAGSRPAHAGYQDGPPMMAYSGSGSRLPPLSGPYDGYGPARAATYRTSPPGSRSGRAPMGGPSHGPMRAFTGGPAPRGPIYRPVRNMTAPMPFRAPAGDYYYDRCGMPQRAASPYDMRGPSRWQYGPSQGMPPSNRAGPYGYDMRPPGGRGYPY